MIIKITQCLVDGANMYTANLKKLVLASLVALYIMIASLGTCAGAMIIGMLMLVAALDDKKEIDSSIPYIFKGFKFFMPSLLIYVGVLIVFLFISFIGKLIGLDLYFSRLIAFVLVFAIGIAIMYSFFFIYEQGANCVTACMNSFNLVKKDVLGSFLILLLTKMISGSFMLSKGFMFGRGGFLIIGMAIVVFMMPLGLCIYYKAYKMLSTEVNIEAEKKVEVTKNTSEAKTDTVEEKKAEKVEEENEASDGIKKEKPVEPEVLPPENIDTVDDDAIGI